MWSTHMTTANTMMHMMTIVFVDNTAASVSCSPADSGGGVVNSMLADIVVVVPAGLLCLIGIHWRLPAPCRMRRHLVSGTQG